MRFLLTAGLSTLISSALVHSIDLNDGPRACDDIWLSVNNQTQLDFYSTCPVFSDVIFIGDDFTGPFKLPGIESVGRISAGYFGPKIRGSTRKDDPVTTIEFPDLKNTTMTYMGGIMAAYLTHLTNVSFPKLEHVTGDIVIVGNSVINRKIEFPALKSVSGGIWISLPSLKEVGYMKVRPNGDDFDCVAFGKNHSSLVFTAKEKPLFGDFGLICSTYYENNRWNSSDPEGNAKASGPSSTGSAAANPTGSASGSAENAAVDLRIGCVNGVLASVGVALVGGLLM
ncbi:hypothetical protein V492_00950 [Pseudogymnoascus sp. VKM F-4246]|nr:hypothetical protein V492_00950 [Pseudogymnoascus sp. VKM F-4246]